MRYKAFGAFKTKLTGPRLATSQHMQKAASARMPSNWLQRGSLVPAGVVTSSKLLRIKDNGLLNPLLVHTQAPSSGKYTIFLKIFLQLMYISAHIAKWVAESNRPANIVSDPELINLLTTGHPHLKVPSPNTVRRDVKVAHVKCRERIINLLQDYPGRIHFATDAWTSTNHHAFVAWTVHLKHNGNMLAFLLDILEVPESHTGVVLAKTFQKVLETFNLQDRVSLSSNVMHSNLSSLQILAMSADNATSNDTQVEALAGLPNSFVPEHRVRCFNHTLQLSAKALLRPFNAGLDNTTKGGDNDDIDDLVALSLDDDDDDEDEDEDGEGDGEGDGEDEDLPAPPNVDDIDDVDDGIDELDALSAEEREEILTDTVAVRETITKVCI
jgi:hypothetical protein